MKDADVARSYNLMIKEVQEFYYVPQSTLNRWGKAKPKRLRNMCKALRAFKNERRLEIDAADATTTIEVYEEIRGLNDD